LGSVTDRGGPGAIGPGLCGFPRITVLGFSVNRGDPPSYL
jgi:hypothetical protein